MFHAKLTFTVVHAQTSAYGQKVTHSTAWVVFSPSLCVHANLGQQSAAAIHFLDHVRHYHQPIKNKGWTIAIPHGQTLDFLFKGFGGHGQPNAPQFSFLRKLEEHSPAHSCPACPHAMPSFGGYFLFTCPLYGSCRPIGMNQPSSLTSEAEHHKI